MTLLVFPNQLFAEHPGLIAKPDRILLVEDSLFFGDSVYPLMFHKQKLWLHRASMRRYEKRLIDEGYRTVYLEYCPNQRLKIDQLLATTEIGDDELLTIEPVDFILRKRMEESARQLRLELVFLRNPGFLNSDVENSTYRSGKKRWFMADFYKWQRRRLDVLVEEDEPIGGKWSLDGENRKKIPKKLLGSIPELKLSQHDEIDEEAKFYVEEKFASNPGSIDRLFYPTSHAEARKWLNRFLKQRFKNFGDFEDAIVADELWLWHSVLTPSLNIGLLTPQQIVEATLDFANKNKVPLNSLEGFIRQIIGWREFMRATYVDLGVEMRTTNFWEHRRKIPDCFYDGTTGIEPVDNTILRVLKTGYCHHIERLMVLGGFMFVCEFDPDEIYRWFMELFVDSYDWVMVPNVYAMSQNADGGLITTKPYFSGSSYIKKMSHYKNGPWCEVWDGLYWRWISIHADKLSKNPRWAMMCSMAKKMDGAKLNRHLQVAEEYLSQLEGS